MFSSHDFSGVARGNHNGEGDLEAEGPVLIQLHMEEEEEEDSLVAVAANMHTIVAVVMAMEEMEEEEEDPLMEERTKIIKPV